MPRMTSDCLCEGLATFALALDCGTLEGAIDAGKTRIEEYQFDSYECDDTFACKARDAALDVFTHASLSKIYDNFLVRLNSAAQRLATMPNATLQQARQQVQQEQLAQLLTLGSPPPAPANTGGTHNSAPASRRPPPPGAGGASTSGAAGRE